MMPLVALDRAIAAIAAEAPATVARSIDASAGLMVRQPWRIAAVVYPFVPVAWPIEGKSSVAVLAECRRQIRDERARVLGEASYGIATHYVDLIALRSAEEALIRMLAADGACVEAVARAIA